MDKLFGMILPKETFKNLSLTSKLTTSFTKGTMEGAVAGVIDGVGGGIVKDEWDKVGEKTFNSAIGGGIMSMGSVGLNQIFKNNKSNTKSGKNTPQLENELIPDINSTPETNVTSFPKTESPVTHPNGKYLPAIIPSQNLMLNPSNTVIPNRPQVIRQNLLPQRH